MEPDRIVKQALLRAPRSRVWRAISDSEEFGYWFGMTFDSPFAAGTRMSAVIVPTQVDPEIAAGQEAYSGTAFDIFVEQIIPERLFSFRWHPGAVDPAADHSNEPTTLVEFTLEDAPEGTLLTVTETGFDKIDVARRAAVFAQNEGGWAAQMKLISKYLADAAQDEV